MPIKLSTEEIDRYERDGFLSPVTIMSPEEAGEFRRALEAAEARWPEAFEGAHRNNAHLNFTFLDELVHDSRLLDAVEDLIGPDILVYGSVLFIKEPGDPGFVSWHQDATYMGLEPHTGVTAWLALSPSNRESGCMRMVPGSHKDDIRKHEDTFADTNILTRGQTIGDVDEAHVVDLVLEPGQLSFHHMRTIHGSQPNLSDDRRIGFVIQCYLQPHVRQTKGKTFVQVARGTDGQGNFPYVPRPREDMQAGDVAMRDEVNALWSDILYQGADKRRNY